MLNYLLIAVIFLQVLATCFIVIRLVTMGREERRDLEDRLMAIQQPVALMQTKSHQDESPPSPIVYVDESAEWNLSASGGGHGS